MLIECSCNYLLFCDGLMKLQLEYTSCIDSASNRDHAEQSEGKAEQQQSEANAMQAVLASEKAKHATLCKQQAYAARKRRSRCFQSIEICNFDNSFN